MLWVYDHYKYFHPLARGSTSHVIYGSQILTSKVDPCAVRVELQPSGSTKDISLFVRIFAKVM